MADNPLNAVNRGVYISDNLEFLKRLNDSCIDLVCIDPPFAKNETFGRKNDMVPDPLRPPLTREEERTELALLGRWGIGCPEQATAKGIDWPATAYKDFWSWEGDVHESWLRDIEDDYPAIAKLIDVTREIHSDGTAAYLCYMAIRLFEIRRVLKNSGSLYLHCDHTAGAYLRQLLDGIFGRRNFRSAIVWERNDGRGKGSQHGSRTWGVQTDTILYYTKSDLAKLNPNIEIDSEGVRREFPHVDSDGRRYKTGIPIFRSKSMGARPNLCFEWRGYTNPHPSGWRLSKERLEEEYQRGNVVIRPNGKLERRKYLDEYAGKPVGDLWLGIPPAKGDERTGYPTQKPVALGERIIRASCPEGGVVLDCFAGCAYVPIAAERLNRNWVACDINPRAWTVFKRQFAKPKLVQLECAEPMPVLGQQRPLQANIVTVHGPDELPTGTIRVEASPRPLAPPKPPGFKEPTSIIPKDRMLEFLLDLSDYQAWCYGFANRMPDGTVVRTTNNFHLDHLDPKSKDGSDEIFNRAPMCSRHNTRKNARRVHLDDYREEIAAGGELLVNSVADLVHLPWAQYQVREFWHQERLKFPTQVDLQGRPHLVRPGGRRRYGGGPYGAV